MCFDFNIKIKRLFLASLYTHEDTSATTRENVLQAPQNIFSMRRPKAGMVETKTLRDMISALTDKNVAFLHLYGLPGSGKTQLVYKLGEHFRAMMPLSVVFDLDINRSDTREKLKTLVDDLRKENYLQKNESQLIQSDLENNKADKLLDVLFESPACVLVAFRHVQENDDLLRDFVRGMKEKSWNQGAPKFYACITSRKRFSMFSRTEIEDLNVGGYFLCERQQVRGFEKKEAVEFFNKVCSDVPSEEVVNGIFERCSGLPLLMSSAVKYCQDKKITYEAYLKDFDNINLKMLLLSEKEKSLYITKEHKHEHPFFSIAEPFECQSTDRNFQLDFLACLSHLDIKQISEKIWKFFYKEFCQYPTLVDDRAENFISKLEEENLCTKFEDKSICFENVVATAFVIMKKIENSKRAAKSCFFNSLEKAIDLLCALSENALSLNNLSSHFKRLESQAEKNRDIRERSKTKLAQYIKKC